MTIEITRLDLSAAELRAQAARAEEPNVSRRLLATGLILDGRSRHDAAQACAMDRQTLRDWVHRYNEAGPEGLRNRPRRNGPPPPPCCMNGRGLGAWQGKGTTCCSNPETCRAL